MRLLWLRRGVPLLVLAALGCSSTPVPQDEGEVIHLGTQTDISLASWLTEPRAAQAEKLQAKSR